MDKARLEALLERVETATGPDRGLDDAIAFATQYRPDSQHDRLGSFADHEAKHNYETAWIAHAPWRSQWDIPFYTGSIDAALALVERVLPGWTVANLSQQDDKSWFCELREGFLTSYDRVATSFGAYGKLPLTAPLAILAALLRALIGRADA